MVQLKQASILLTLAALTVAWPVVQDSTNEDATLSVRQVASCETQTAAEQVSCIEACSGNPGCIVGW